ncbi:alpha/beta fold hydrolase [Amycolatopsis pithecellobii]|uniref:Alpha/beta fold hydrolase n=1 Tax=Amycolatopsis pithecellobii TaxID=664692 RepID=A0A6N7YNZ9_9PSEU|nr:alpha/beta hydrolase [Amycolatopsis pithecellobii]MTD54725.1 alpha/beta fold hydrolase [Amycolatopsis pithecellobii]
MTVVFIHGVPETPVVWDVVRQRLDVDSEVVHLPGFGIPRPAELDSNEAYASWLVDRLREMPGPLDLVAHDWGAHLTIRAVSAYGINCRSWVADVGEAWHPDYAWHGGAQMIQSPQGRDFLAGMTAPAGSFAGYLRPRGINDASMDRIDHAADKVMTDTMYLLYRDAVPNFYTYNSWGPQMEAARSVPGLIVCPDEDPYASVDLSRQTAGRLDAEFAVLPGKSHYWMHQDPDGAVRLLRDFWQRAKG